MDFMVLLYCFLSAFLGILLVKGLAFGEKKLPPGTLGWCPFLGQTLDFLEPHFSNTRGKFLEENVKRYGKIFKTHVFGSPTIISCDAEFNCYVLHNEDRFLLSSYPTNIPTVLGDRNLLVVHDDLHRRLRSPIVSFMTTLKAQDSTILSDTESYALKIMGSWEKEKIVVFCEEVRKFTFSVIVKEVLGLEPEEPEATQILKNFTKFMEGLVSFPINLPGTAFAKAIHARKTTNAIIIELFAKGKKERRFHEGRRDFMSFLLKQKDLSDQEKISLIMDILFGGYETSSMLIALMVNFLSENPKALHQLREEHQRIKSNKGERRLRWEDYKSMTFTQDIINETLRCGNVVKFVHRKVIKPIHYKDYVIPVGWKVLPILSGVHLDSSYYSNPSEFNPWRSQNKNGETNTGSKSFIPFGGGIRHCPGSDFARIETAVFLHHLVLNYSWTILNREDRPMLLPYLNFKDGLKITIQSLSEKKEEEWSRVE